MSFSFDHSILVVVVTEDRMHRLIQTVESLMAAHRHHSNWKLAVIDLGTNSPTVQPLSQVLGRLKDKLSVYSIGLTPTLRETTHNRCGWAINRAIRESGCELVVLLHEGMQVHERHLHNLDMYYAVAQNTIMSHSQLCFFDPTRDEIADVMKRRYAAVEQRNGCLVGHHESTYQDGDQLKSGQVSWRSSLNTQAGVWFDEYSPLWETSFYMAATSTHADYSIFNGGIGPFVPDQLAALGNQEAERLYFQCLADFVNGRAVEALDNLTKAIALDPVYNTKSDLLAKLRQEAGGSPPAPGLEVATGG